MPVVLLVEDNADTREMYASFLGAEGFRVLEAEDGLQALCQLAGEKPDLMLLDLGLPRLSGVQVLRAIRQQPRLADLPVVVVSGQLDLLNAADEIAADVICPKPCEPEELLRAVRSVLDRERISCPAGLSHLCRRSMTVFQARLRSTFASRTAFR